MKPSPGICLTRTTMFDDKKLFKRTAKFIGSLNGKIADMGCENAKSNYLANYFNVEIDQVDYDFNFDFPLPKKYDTILCLEVLEHLQNPLFFMKNVKNMLTPKGVLYLSTPSRFRFLWTEKHFFEMSQRHLRKWILAPLDLKIMRSKSRGMTFKRPWWFYFTGIRPLFRLFFDNTRIYEIRQDTWVNQMQWDYDRMRDE